MATVEEIARFRLLLDDAAGALFDDAAVGLLVTEYTDVRLAVAGAARILALRYSGGIRKFSTDGQTFERGSRSAAYEALALRLEAEVAAETGAVTTSYMTRIDGNSDDISAEDANAYGTLDGTGRVGWRFANVHGDEPMWLPE